MSGPRPGRRRRRIIAAGVALAMVALSGAAVVRWLSGERSIDASRVRIAEVTRGTFVRDAAVNGRVVAAVSPTLYAPVSGTIALEIRAGDAVAKGDVLAVLDSPELRNQLGREQSMLQQLEAQRGSARIAVQQQRLTARREADEAKIALTTATRELQISERGWKEGTIAELEYLRARDAVESAKVRHDNAVAEARLASKSAGFQLDNVEQELERQRLVVADLERRVAELTMNAPVGGVIGTVSVADRAVVAANTPIMTVVDLSQLEIELEVPESYADDLGLGMAVEIRLGGSNATGTLSALSPEVVDDHVLARVRFDGAQPAGLRQSQRVAARILIEERQGVVMIARGPFLEAHGGRHAYVVEDGIAVRRPVRLGATSVAEVEVLEGLAPGDRVVIAGTDTFEDADSVRLND